ncbi:uncharacterized protein I303_104901 [Kwoniella dejecticola CBS 10117]|uniref:WD40 repeat-like protein n=1 Tax=Kwoniella dejecticola CBS 10117 TaxID=1296121 RepID=A0A1A6A413_9TREE|nr:uncharacterized protein I303_05653 [Kwoniella dejecticola CBS 10117]OBR84794.1 hypothetical protein I303_05653 [Kwoniella dejecticola CBS 10117]
MLPSEPPRPSSRDFDPSITNGADDDIEMRSEVETTAVDLSSVEINILIYLYLLESNFTHTAFSLLSESNLPSTSLFQHFNPSYPTPSHLNNGRSSRPNGAIPTQGTSKSPVQPNFGRAEGRIERGELIRKLWKAVRWEEVERHVAANGEPYKPACPNPFHLLIPHVCPPAFPSAELNPPLPLPEALQAATPPTPPPAPPPERPEAFPPPLLPPEPVAGPSKGTPAPENSNKRKTRQSSSAEVSRRASRDRSASPSKSRVAEREAQVAKEAQEAMEAEEAQESKEAQEAKEAKEVKREKKEEKKRSRSSEDGARRLIGDNILASDNGDPNDRPLKIRSTKKKENWVDPGADVDSRVDTPDPRRSSPGVENRRVGKFVEHRDAVSCVAWNPKNIDVLATGSSDGTARLWEFADPLKEHLHVTTTKKPTVIHHKSIESSRRNVTAVSWHPDGTMLATGSYDGVGRLFTPSGSIQGIMTYGRGVVNAMKWNPSGSTILMAKDDFTVTKWAYGVGGNMEMKLSFDSHTKEVNDVDWLDDDVFASAGNDHTIFVHRSNDRRPRFTFKGHTDDVTRIKWSPVQPGKPATARLLASASDDGYIMIWKLPSYPEAATRNGTSRSTSPQKAKEGSTEDDYFGGGTPVPGVDHCLHRLKVVKISDNKRMNTLEWNHGQNGRLLVAAGGQDSAVIVFDAISGQIVYNLEGLESGTGSLAFAPASFGGKLGALAAGGWNGHLFLWDLDSGDVLMKHTVEEDEKKQDLREQPMMLALAWREDGKHLACGLQNKSLLVLNVEGLLKSDGKGKK